MYAQVNVLTANGDNGRTGANLQEVELSPATISPDSFGKVGEFPVDGQVYAQVLAAGGITIPGKGVRNVIYVCTMHNSVYAFDAGATPPDGQLWHINLGTPVPSTQLYGPFGDVSNEVGIMGTGAIDLQRGVLYLVAETLHSGVPAFFLHALDLGTGQERLNGPVEIVASVAGTGTGAGPDGTLAFDPRQHLQRPGLLLANNLIYAGFGSHGDKSPWHGWLMSYNAADLTQAGVFNATPMGDGGAFWQSGRGIAADDNSNLYAVTGNGDYDGATNFGQSFLKLFGATPKRISSYTPPDWKTMSDNDFDLSGGPALVPGTNLFIGADKIGNLYTLDRSTMAQVGSAPAFFSAAQSSIFSVAIWGRTGNSLVYVQGTREPLKAYRATATGVDPNPVATASFTVEFGRIGMSLSADGARSGSGILWQTSGNYNDGSAPGTLRAFDAGDLSELWSSEMNPARDRMPPVAKFVGPTVANGRVYVPTFGNAVAVYGLIGGLNDPAPAITSFGNAATYEPQTVSPGQMVAIFGTDIGPSTPAGMQLDESGSVTSILGGTRVFFGSVAGAMAFAGSGQVNAFVPFDIPQGTARIQVEARGRTSPPVEVQVQESAPGLFTSDGSGKGQALAINPDGTVNSPDNPAPAGSVVLLYATGVGALSPGGQDGAVGQQSKLASLPVSASIGDQSAKVLYTGTAPGMVEGIIQVNLKIPDDTPGDPALPVVLTVGSHSSPPGVTLAVK